jgi:hypothetical protein
MQDPPGRRRRLRPGDSARIGRRALFGRLRRSGIGVGRSPSPPRWRTFGRGQRSWQLKRRGQLQVGRGLWVVSRRRGAAQLRIAFGLGVVCEPNPGQFRHEPKSIGRGVSNRHRPVRERNGQPSALPSDRAAHRQLGATQRPGLAPARRGLHLAARHRSGPAQHSPEHLSADDPSWPVSACRARSRRSSPARARPRVISTAMRGRSILTARRPRLSVVWRGAAGTRRSDCARPLRPRRPRRCAARRSAGFRR